MLKTHEQFIIDANIAHNNQYQYLSQYVNAKTKIEIKHKICGHIFYQTPNNHISGKTTCTNCSRKNKSTRLTKTHTTFITEANEIHDNNFLYIDNYINDATKIKMQHNKCGHIFLQRAGRHLQGDGCPNCGSSKGEKLIKQWLETNNIQFIYQHKFDECFNPETKRKLKFDFYLSQYNTIIEVDGLQHNQPVRFIGMTEQQAELAFIKGQKLDAIKNSFCLQQHIELIRLNFLKNKINNDKIDEILLQIIS